METLNFSINATLSIDSDDLRTMPRSLHEVLEKPTTNWKLFVVFGELADAAAT